MTREEKIYTALCGAFSVVIVIGNLTYQKIVSLPIPHIYHFELSVGAISYPLTFILTDLITELYGKEKANFCVKFGIAMNIMAALILAGMDYLDATPWSKVSDATFHHVFGVYSIAFLGSIIACYVAQSIDIVLYLWIRKLTRGKYLWLRNNGSTTFSLFVDTTVAISFLTAFGVLPAGHMWALILNSYAFKLFFTVCNTPLFYVAVGTLRYFMKDSKQTTIQTKEALYG